MEDEKRKILYSVVKEVNGVYFIIIPLFLIVIVNMNILVFQKPQSFSGEGSLFIFINILYLMVIVWFINPLAGVFVEFHGASRMNSGLIQVIITLLLFIFFFWSLFRSRIIGNDNTYTVFFLTSLALVFVFVLSVLRIIRKNGVAISFFGICKKELEALEEPANVRNIASDQENRALLDERIQKFIDYSLSVQRQL